MRVCRWALRNDHCNRSQEQPQPFSAQERLCLHAPRRNNRQLSRRNSTGSNRSPAEYWIPERKVLLQRLPHGRYGRLPWPNHCRTHPLKILNRIGLPARHDGAYGHGSGCRDHSIWHPRPSKRRNDMGLAWLQRQPRQVKRARYRLILVRGSDLAWLNRDRLQEVKAGLAAEHKWIPVQNLPFPEVVLYAYAADRTPFPTYVCLPSGLYKARTGQIVAQTGPEQEILPLSGMYFFDGWRVHPTLPIPATYHAPKKRQSGISLLLHPQLVRNRPARQKKKRETSLRQPPRIMRKMGQIQGGQRSAHVST